MEKISIQTTYTRISIYARYSGAASAKNGGANAGGEAETGKSGKSLECGRSKDGDTFSLSIEARTIRISESYEVSGGEALQAISGPHAKQGKDDRHRHHFLSLENPGDVAENLLEQITRRHATQGGSKADAAADIKKRLADWKPAAGKATVEYLEFRSQVHMRLSQGLDAWVQDRNAPAPGPAAEAGDGAGSSAVT
ncbi:MAG: hypothetical protein ABI036_21250 [Fibrobacteria bacterium]